LYPGRVSATDSVGIRYPQPLTLAVADVGVLAIALIADRLGVLNGIPHPVDQFGNLGPYHVGPEEPPRFGVEERFDYPRILAERAGIGGPATPPIAYNPGTLVLPKASVTTTRSECEIRSGVIAL